MKITNADIFNGYQAIAHILGAGLRPKATFTVSRLIKTLGPIYEEITNTKQDLLNKYGEKEEDGTLKVNEVGNIIFSTPEDESNFFEDIKEVLNVENEILCSPININDLETAERPIESSVILAIMPFISEE